MIDMVKDSRFVRPSKGLLDSGSSPNLYVANCGPAVGISFEDIASVFSTFGEVRGVHAADESGARVVVCFFDDISAQKALKAFDGNPCPQLGGRVLHIRYSILQPSSQIKDSVSVSLVASELQIPGLFLLHDFITSKDEEELLAAVDDRPWKSLSKRRVQHYGYEFMYDTRNVNTKHHLGELPQFVSTILQKISSFPNLEDAGNAIVDQLTVNEYPPGVGLSPHIDTHSAFEGLIFSLSLAGPCIMEFRRYSQGSWLPPSASSMDNKGENPDNCSNILRRSLFLPPRSMLLLSGEARYAWHHYIPHHKVDMVRGDTIRRGARRVSLTFRKVRNGPCCCEFPQYCDSQRSVEGLALGSA
ncbi:RNA recognition motif domain [Macleaya cordata]|uniref:RNA recognition motif domain n=1 Tax=Macleaya cordata TaxID=56857 RepID=A0A200R6Q9_MACCD|nr:RNA recognition motif domain [Macleaya cordata]